VLAMVDVRPCRRALHDLRHWCQRLWNNQSIARALRRSVICSEGEANEAPPPLGYSAATGEEAGICRGPDSFLAGGNAEERTW
jgi:hypothetical protein